MVLPIGGVANVTDKFEVSPLLNPFVIIMKGSRKAHMNSWKPADLQ